MIVNRWSLWYGLLAAIVVQLPCETVSGAAGVREDSAPSASHVDVTLYLQESASEHVLRKWASFQMVGTEQPLLVKEIVLDDVDLNNLPTKLLAKQPLSQSPFSYPVFLDGFFAGVEFPVAATRIENNHVIVGHNPGLRMQPGEVKAQERSPLSRLRYLFHGWTVLPGLSA
ncbi:MAG: hypothetical protein ACYC3X_28195 [Pirellulaceae bacterium]